MTKLLQYWPHFCGILHTIPTLRESTGDLSSLSCCVVRNESGSSGDMATS